MKTQSQTSNRQVEFGVRWIVAALLILCAMSSAHAEDRRSANANLHISVTVVPILQAQAMMHSNQTTAEDHSVTYHLQPVVVRQTREIRSMSTETRAQNRSAAILETVTTIAE